MSRTKASILQGPCDLRADDAAILVLSVHRWWVWVERRRKERVKKLAGPDYLKVSSFPERDRVDKAPLVFLQFLYSTPHHHQHRHHSLPHSLTEAQPHTRCSTGYFNPSSVAPTHLKSGADGGREENGVPVDVSFSQNKKNLQRS